MLDRNGLLLKIDGVSLQAKRLASYEPIECGKDNGEFYRIVLDDLEQMLQFFLIVDAVDKPFFSGTLNSVCRISVDQSDLECVLESLADIGVAVNDRVG